MNSKELFKKYNYIYHRGFYDNKKIPENSLLAFKKCIKNKMPIELDLHLLQDNTIENDWKKQKIKILHL